MTKEYSFGSWIRQRRKALDLTQGDLASKVNCSLSTIAKIESSQRKPSRQIAALLAKHLDVPEDQWEMLIKLARTQKPVDLLAPLPVNLEPISEVDDQKVPCFIPAPATPIVGRKTELAEIIRLLKQPDCRLLTISGPGGVGKTRLSIQIAHDLNATSPPLFSDGVCFVSLASVQVIDHIPKAIASAIHFNLSGPLSPEDQLLNYFHKRKMLIVLDGAEHVLTGAETIRKILLHAEGINILVTSRMRLNLSSEWVFDLQGLPVPPLAMDEGMEVYGALKLFIDRARQVVAGFSLDAEERPVAVRICRLLDGNPLGIELAASWVRTLPLSEIAAEIEHDQDFLTTSASDVPERQRSLRVVFEHSWNLLSHAEQRCLRQLSAFQGGFTRKSAEVVAGTKLSHLNSLLNKSMLRRYEPARYDLHELVRGFAASRLVEETAEESATQMRHSQYFLSRLCEIGKDLQSSRQKVALAMLSAEMANIRLAWAWAVAHDQIEQLSAAAWSLWYFLDLLNYYREAEAIFADAAGLVRRRVYGRQSEIAADRAKYSLALGRFLMHQAYFAMRLGRVADAEPISEASIATLRAIGRPETLAHALAFKAVLMWTTGEVEQAWQLLRESLPLSREHGTPWQMALFTGLLGNVAYERGEYVLSYQLLMEALERSQAIGDPRLIGYVSAYIGRSALILKRTAEIEGVLRRGAQLTQESGDRFGYGLMLEQLALAAQTKGDYVSAESYFKAAMDIFEEIGDGWSLARTLTTWGDFKLALGNLQQAAENFRQAVMISRDERASLITLSALVGLAMVYAQEEKADTALEIALFVACHPASSHDAKASAKKICHILESKLTTNEVQADSQQTRFVSIEEFVSALLSDYPMP